MCAAEEQPPTDGLHQLTDAAVPYARRGFGDRRPGLDPNQNTSWPAPTPTHGERSFARPESGAWRTSVNPPLASIASGVSCVDPYLRRVRGPSERACEAVGSNWYPERHSRHVDDRSPHRCLRAGQVRRVALHRVGRPPAGQPTDPAWSPGGELDRAEGRTPRHRSLPWALNGRIVVSCRTGSDRRGWQLRYCSFWFLGALQHGHKSLRSRRRQQPPAVRPGPPSPSICRPSIAFTVCDGMPCPSGHREVSQETVRALSMSRGIAEMQLACCSAIP